MDKRISSNLPYAEIEHVRLDLDADTLIFSSLDTLGRWSAGAISPVVARDLARELLRAADLVLLRRVGGDAQLLQEVGL